MADKDPDDFGPYASYLHTHVWPSVNPRSGEWKHTLVDRDEMPPQYAAACLAKLVRWARIAPQGDITLYPDEDSREVEVRSTPLGKALAARAVNLDEDMFFGLYGEFGTLPDANLKEVMAELAVALGDHGLDWTLQQRIKLAAELVDVLIGQYKITEKTP